MRNNTNISESIVSKRVVAATNLYHGNAKMGIAALVATIQACCSHTPTVRKESDCTEVGKCFKSQKNANISMQNISNSISNSSLPSINRINGIPTPVFVLSGRYNRLDVAGSDRLADSSVYVYFTLGSMLDVKLLKRGCTLRSKEHGRIIGLLLDDDETCDWTNMKLALSKDPKCLDDLKYLKMGKSSASKIDMLKRLNHKSTDLVVRLVIGGASGMSVKEGNDVLDLLRGVVNLVIDVKNMKTLKALDLSKNKRLRTLMINMIDDEYSTFPYCKMPAFSTARLPRSLTTLSIKGAYCVKVELSGSRLENLHLEETLIIGTTVQPLPESLIRLSIRHSAGYGAKTDPSDTAKSLAPVVVNEAMSLPNIDVIDLTGTIIRNDGKCNRAASTTPGKKLGVGVSPEMDVPKGCEKDSKNGQRTKGLVRKGKTKVLCVCPGPDRAEVCEEKRRRGIAIYYRDSSADAVKCDDGTSGCKHANQTKTNRFLKISGLAEYIRLTTKRRFVAVIKDSRNKRASMITRRKLLQLVSKVDQCKRSVFSTMYGYIRMIEVTNNYRVKMRLAQYGYGCYVTNLWDNKRCYKRCGWIIKRC